MDTGRSHCRSRLWQSHAYFFMGPLASGIILKDRYQLTMPLGQGGYGTVWLAEDLRTQDRVALKILSAELHKQRDAEERLAREAEVLLSLRHAHIVGARDFHGGGEGLPAFLVLDYVAGQSLSEAIKARARTGQHYTAAQAAQIFADICEAVAFAHQAGVIHRDLKPANIMLRAPDGPHPRALVLDFGLAKILHGDTVDATTLGRRLGTFLYMSPEQALGQPAEPSTDIFGLGTLLFELLTLHRAWALDHEGRCLPMLQGPIVDRAQNSPATLLRRIASGPRPQLSAYRPELGGLLNEALQHALHPQPHQRHSSPIDFSQQVQSALRSAGDRPAAPAPMVDAELQHARLPLVEDSACPESTALAPAQATMPAPVGPRLLPGLIGAAVITAGVAGGLLIAGALQPSASDPSVGPAAAPSPQAAPGVVATPRESTGTDKGPTVPVPPPPPARVAPAKASQRRRKQARPKKKKAQSKLRAQLADLKAHPGDLVRLEALSEALMQRSKQMRDRGQALTVQRLARTAAMVGDVEALASAVEILEADRGRQAR